MRYFPLFFWLSLLGLFLALPFALFFPLLWEVTAALGGNLVAGTGLFSLVLLARGPAQPRVCFARREDPIRAAGYALGGIMVLCASLGLLLWTFPADEGLASLVPYVILGGIGGFIGKWAGVLSTYQTRINQVQHLVGLVEGFNPHGEWLQTRNRILREKGAGTGKSLLDNPVFQHAETAMHQACKELYQGIPARDPRAIANATRQILVLLHSGMQGLPFQWAECYPHMREALESVNLPARPE